MVTKHLHAEKKICCLIEAARGAFNTMKTLFCNDNQNFKLQQQMMKNYCYPVFMYDRELSLEAITIRCPETFEI